MRENGPWFFLATRPSLQAFGRVRHEGKYRAIALGVFFIEWKVP